MRGFKLSFSVLSFSLPSSSYLFISPFFASLQMLALDAHLFGR